MQEFEVDFTKKYAQLILNFFWVVYFERFMWIPFRQNSLDVLGYKL